MGGSTYGNRAMQRVEARVYTASWRSVQYADGKHSAGRQAASARFRHPIDSGAGAAGPGRQPSLPCPWPVGRAAEHGPTGRSPVYRSGERELCDSDHYCGCAGRDSDGPAVVAARVLADRWARPADENRRPSFSRGDRPVRQADPRAAPWAHSSAVRAAGS